MAFRARCEVCGKVYTKNTNQGTVSALNQHQVGSHGLESMTGSQMGVKEVDAIADPPAQFRNKEPKRRTAQVRKGAEVRQATVVEEEDVWIPPTKEEWDALVRKHDLLKDLFQRMLMEVV